ncbi:hypothetical protein QYE76_051306 [Lolium multiflorum]|uniref:CCHC-type domain-containing protein n=1 Tax=Lolium multiflorum TaxID=4521 RepID=A0AAD8SRH8_LOLMU|nr:hypothetical protein QYE76_051306 [Lolium multiflorum]
MASATAQLSPPFPPSNAPVPPPTFSSSPPPSSPSQERWCSGEGKGSYHDVSGEGQGQGSEPMVSDEVQGSGPVATSGWVKNMAMLPPCSTEPSRAWIWQPIILHKVGGNQKPFYNTLWSQTIPDIIILEKPEKHDCTTGNLPPPSSHLPPLDLAPPPPPSPPASGKPPMASPTPSHVSATPANTPATAGTEDRRWLGDLDSPLSSDSSSDNSFAAAVQRALAPPASPVSPAETAVQPQPQPGRRFNASPVRFPEPAPSPLRRPASRAAAAGPSKGAPSHRPSPAPAAPLRSAAPRVDADGFVQPHGRLYRRRNRRSASPPSPLPPPPPHYGRPVPADLWGLCFNCCRPGHKAVECWYPSRCLRCHEEGHRAADVALCMRQHSPPAVEDPRPAQRRRASSPPPPPPRQAPRPAPAPPTTNLARQPHDSARTPAMDNRDPLVSGRATPATPLANNQVAPASAPAAGVAAQHAPPSLEELMHHRPERTLFYICRSPTISEAESTLADAVTVMIVGSWPAVSRAQLAEFISARFSIAPDSFDIYDYAPEDFLVHFSNNDDRNRTLAVAGVLSAPTFKCTIKPWTRLAHAQACICHYRAVVDIYGMPPNASCLGTVSSILAPCSVYERILTERSDRSKFRVAVWTQDPTTIPFSSVLFVEEPSPNAAGDDTQLNMLAYNLSIKVREVTRVPSVPPPSPSPSPSSNRGDYGSRHGSRRQYDSSHSNGRSVNFPDHGRDGKGAPPRFSRFQGQPRHWQVINISSSASSGSSPTPSSRPPAASSVVASASSTAPSSRRRRRGKKDRKRTTATC